MSIKGQILADAIETAIKAEHKAITYRNIVIGLSVIDIALVVLLLIK